MSIEDYAAQCAGTGNSQTLRHLLLEGVDANALNGSFLEIAAISDEPQIISLLIKYGAKIDPEKAMKLLVSAVTSAAPMVLREVIVYYNPTTLQAALRRHDYFLIVIAGDSLLKARRYQKQGVKLTKVGIQRRRVEFLGDAVRLAVWKRNERMNRVWAGIVERTQSCVQILKDAFKPKTSKDRKIMADWLEI